MASFSVVVTKHPDKDSIRQEGFIPAQVQGILPIMAGRSRQQGLRQLISRTHDQDNGERPMFAAACLAPPHFQDRFSLYLTELKFSA